MSTVDVINIAADSQAVDDGQAIDDGPGVVDVQAVDVSPTDVDGQAVADSQDVDDSQAVDDDQDVDNDADAADSARAVDGQAQSDKSAIFTGCTRTVLGTLQQQTVKLPATPPVRGRACYKKPTKKRLQLNCKGPAAKKQKVATTAWITDSKDLSDIENGSCLNDRHMFAVSSLLQQQFSNVQGLCDCVLGSKLQFPVCTGPFCQILHDGRDHWLTVSNIMAPQTEQVDVYDSSFNTVSLPVKMPVACMIRLQANAMKLNMRVCTRQRGATDCGLFAIASAVALCFGKDPSSLQFEQSALRPWLMACLTSGKMTEAPGTVISDRSKKIFLKQ